MFVKSLVRVLGATRGLEVKDSMFCVCDRRIARVVMTHVVSPLSRFIVFFGIMRGLSFEHLYLFGLFSDQVRILGMRT